MIRPGARVVVGGLARRPDLNGAHGMVVSRREGDRWAVQLGCTHQPVSVAGTNLALAASQAAHAHCMVIEALPLSASNEQVRAAIRPFSRAGLPLATEAAEVRALQRELCWRDVQGLQGYTEHARYRDLYIYFDHADTVSPANELATKAFSMYGLRGAACKDWDLIRGPAIVVRAEPPCSSYSEMLARSNVQLPQLTVDEVASTLCYFRERCARAAARERDMIRTLSNGAFLPAAAQGPAPKQACGPAKKKKKQGKKRRKR